MLQEIIDLQQNAVNRLVAAVRSKSEVTFRAPTGSGKTRMMADFMHRVISSEPDVVFLVSTLSKGGLAQQNYDVFASLAGGGVFPNINPHLISTQLSGEESLFIPTDHNVYVLPRDLYKSGGRLMQGAMMNFLGTLKENMFGKGMNKRIYLIKDECHQATNNLDTLSSAYFTKVINFSATPNLKRSQNPDVEISDDEAVNAKLIKHLEMGADDDDVEVAIRKLEEIREDYINLLGVNPCLIIQISNKDKAEAEWQRIEEILLKIEHQHLKWMSIVDKKEKCKTNDKLGKLPVEKWKEYARQNSSTVDIIVFKMVISEGWDIPRACMLYQVRDSKSKQLDEQVMGRVRRNPRLVDFEHLSADAQKLALTAWVWGIPPENMKKSFQVKLFGVSEDILGAIKIKTTRLKALKERKGFEVEKFISEKPPLVSHKSIFELYKNLKGSGNEVSDMCYDFAAQSVGRWLLFCEHIGGVKKEYDNFICDYNESMEIVKDENGDDKEVSFPVTSTYTDNQNYENIGDWVWRRKDGRDKFSFDSEAEREWASVLKDVSRNNGDTISVGEPNPKYEFGQINLDGTIEPKYLSVSDKYLWGKNYLANSEIKFEYYLDGVHSSYPDFVMKDKYGQIHLFEVKSVNVSGQKIIDKDEYNSKINALKKCYLHCSKLTGYFYYLPVLVGEEWQITRLKDGKEVMMTESQFKCSFSNMHYAENQPF